MNETDLAVALKYLKEIDEAPVVVAKGRGYVAKKILEIAQKYKIPVHRDRDLAFVLEKVEIGAPIPPELYKAVAEILAYIYLMNQKYSPT